MGKSLRLSDYTHEGHDFVFGWLRFEGQKEMAQTCLLQELDGIIRLTVPFILDESEVSCWFKPGYADDEAELVGGLLPDMLWVEEVKTGKVFTLLECRAFGWGCTYGRARAQGYLVSSFVIASNGVGDYRKTSMVRSSSPELFRWIGHSPVELDLSSDESACGGMPRFSFDSKTIDIENLPLAASLFISSNTETGASGEGEWLHVVPFAFFETRFDAPVEISEAIAYHEHLKTLFDIIHWDDVGFGALQLAPQGAETRDEHAGQAALGDVVLKRRTKPRAPFGSRPPAFFGFGDVGPEGLGRWFALRENYGRAISRLGFVATSYEHISAESLVVTLCTVIEEVASVRCRQDEVPVPYGFKKLFQVLAGFVCKTYPSLDKVSVESVGDDIKETYNAIKHTEEERGNRARDYWVAFENLHAVAAACRLLLYAWIATELGCSERRVVECFDRGAYDAMKLRWGFFGVVEEDA